MDATVFDWLTDTLLTGADAERTSPEAVLYLMHEYVRAGRPDVGDAIEASLTSGLERVSGERDPCVRCQWLGVFAGSAAFTMDERPSACVQRLLPEAVDALEQFVRSSYEPGEGLLDRSPYDHIRCATALLTAFELTGRLPYSMLAEELFQAARRNDWDEQAGRFSTDFRVNCLAIRLCCAIATLHHEPDYLARAVVAQDATYGRDAERLLDETLRTYRDHPDAAAEFGLALVHWLALRALPN